MATRPVILEVSAQDKASATLRRVQGATTDLGTAAGRATRESQSLGAALDGIRPKGDAISAMLGVLGVGVGAVAGTFAAAAGASQRLSADLERVSAQSSSTLRALGDVISESAAFQAAIDATVSALTTLEEWISRNESAISQLVTAALDPLATAAVLATNMVAGLAMSFVVLQRVAKPYLDMVIGGGRLTYGALPAAVYGASQAEGTGLLAVPGMVAGAVRGVFGGAQQFAAGAAGAYRGLQDAETLTSAIDALRAQTVAQIELLRGGAEGGRTETFAPLDVGGGRRLSAGRPAARAAGAPLIPGEDATMPGALWGRSPSFMFGSAGGDLGAVYAQIQQQQQAYEESIRVQQEAVQVQEETSETMTAFADAFRSAGVGAVQTVGMLAAQFLFAGESARMLGMSVLEAVGGTASGIGGSLMSSGNPYAMAAGAVLTIGGEIARGYAQSEKQAEADKLRKRSDTWSVANPLPVRVVADDTIRREIVGSIYVSGGGAGPLATARQARDAALEQRRMSRAGMIPAAAGAR